MTYSIPGYDAWKLASPDWYDEETECTCESCGGGIDESIADETELCEDCLCEDDECEGCIYCLSVAGYNEAKADGTLKVE